MISAIRTACLDWLRTCSETWNRFWFTPADHSTLCLIRVLVGLMLVYTHAIWTLDLPAFFSSEGVFGPEYQDAFQNGSPFVWSHFHWSDSPTWHWGSHFLSLAILFAFTVGIWTRWTSILAFLIVVSYANRAGGALFGLDQINGFLTLYLAIGPSGRLFSVDAWLANRKSKSNSTKSSKRAGKGSENTNGPSTRANLAIRLMQVHLCVVYLFAGLGKLQGEMWWDGTAIWGALASYEYQTLDMTFLVHLPWLVNLITMVSLAWEVSYAFLIWPKLTRPIVLTLAVLVHLGIGLCMGMITFGVIMVIANLAFIDSRYVENCLGAFGLGHSQQTEPPS